MKTPSTLQTLLTQSFEAERGLRQFSTLASQELLNLLAAALSDLNDSQKNFEGTKENLEKAIFLTRNLRYFSSGPRSEFLLTDLSQLVFDCLQTREPHFQKKKVDLKVSVEASVYGLFDTVGLEQALLNLLDFAASHSKSKSQIEMNLQVIPNGVQFSLSLPGSSQEGVLEPQTLEPSSLENLNLHPFSLLGLYVSSVIVEGHSGTFQCFQSKAQGLYFLLKFPFDSRLNKPHLHQEKRRFQRVKVNFPAFVTLKSGEKIEGQMRVLGAGGCFIALNHSWVERMLIDDPIALHIQIDENHSLSIPRARVANTHPKGENAGVGIEFLELDEAIRSLLAALVKAHAS